MADFLKELKEMLDNKSSQELLQMMVKYDTQENRVGPTMEEFLASHVDSETKSGISEEVKKASLTEVFEFFEGVQRKRLKEQQERDQLWAQMAGTVITGKQFRESVGEHGIEVEIQTSEFAENGKGHLLRSKEKVVLQVNSATLALLRKQDTMAVLDELQLTILPFDIGMDWA